MNGPTDFIYITPAEAVEQDLHGNDSPVEFYERLASNNGLCSCDQHEWRAAGAGLCFACMTGKSDASDDYELGDPY